MEKISLDNTVIEIFPLPCLRVDEHGIITGLNDAAEKLIGLSEAPSVSHCLKGLLRHMRIEKQGSHGKQNR
jgi:PAS domain-containing protein